jgi:hypothetical protein
MPANPTRKLSRLAALALVTAGGIVLVAWVAKMYLAVRLASQVTLYNTRLAAVLDPTDAEYQLKLGLFYQYNPADIDPEQAMVHIRRAVDLAPYDPQTWLDLGAALEFQGDTAKAEACLRRADFLAPNLPPIQWTIANFFLLHGNIDEAFRHFKVALSGSARYNQTIFDTAWKVSGDAGKILEELIPDHPQTEFAYLDYLVSRRNYEAAAGVWKRLVEGPEGFAPAMVNPYLQSLIETHRTADAGRVWDGLRTKGLIPPTYAESSQNLVINGDFENPPLNVGFDWRLIQVEGAYSTLDETTFHSPGHSLLIQFMGAQNLNYQHAMEFVRVEPNHAYRLQGFMRTEGISTDSGVRLQVRDAYDTRILDLFSEDLRGDNGWTPLLLEFKTPAKTDLIAVIITRLPSQKLDNKIAGKAWIDDVTLSPPAPESRR